MSGLRHAACVGYGAIVHGKEGVRIGLASPHVSASGRDTIGTGAVNPAWAERRQGERRGESTNARRPTTRIGSVKKWPIASE